MCPKFHVVPEILKTGVMASSFNNPRETSAIAIIGEESHCCRYRGKL